MTAPHFRELTSPQHGVEKGAPDLRDEIAHLLNKHSVEGYSDTPDFVLARYLMACLQAFESAVEAREEWHGRPLTGRLGPVRPGVSDLLAPKGEKN